jgi:tripartite-type tricarboxylate transporter receptor subunit TctC
MNPSRFSFSLPSAARRSILVAAAALIALPSTAVYAQSYPTKPIKLVVTFPTGGAPDILSRIFSEKAQLGQQVLVDNKPGAGGNIGADFVAKAAPDGHTLVMGTVGTHSINGALYEKMPYDMVKGFAPIALVASAPNLLVVNNDLPVKSVADLIAYLKANPNKLSFGSPGIGSSVHVSGELFKSMTGTSMTHVPYKGRQFAIPDLVGGSIQLMFDNMPSALPMAREGKIRAIAQTTAKRSAAAPDVPTVAEGIPGFEATPGGRCLRLQEHPDPSSTGCTLKWCGCFSYPRSRKNLKRLALSRLFQPQRSWRAIRRARSSSGPKWSRNQGPRPSNG